MLIFLDLETTGLNPERDEILEVAAICVDDQLQEVARYTSLIRPHRPLFKLDEFVRDMHAKNGLLSELRALPNTNILGSFPDPYSQGHVDFMLAGFIRDHGVKFGKDEKGAVTISRPQLAGNTISFDRAFMKHWLPEAHAELHYRNLDVSSLNEMARRFWPTVYEATKQSKPDGAGVEHRAMWDALCSLHQARAYRQLLGPVLEVPCGAV